MIIALLIYEDIILIPKKVEDKQGCIADIRSVIFNHYYKYQTMNKSFQTRIEAINWIAANVENEGQFEVLREQLTFNYIYTETYFLQVDEKELQAEVLLLRRDT